MAAGVLVTVEVTVGSADGLVPGLGVTAPSVLLIVALAVADPVTEGEKIAGVVGDEDDVQPEITTEASRVTAPQPIAVNRTLPAVPAVVVRTLIEPPRAPVRRRIRVPYWREKRHQEGKRVATWSLPRLTEGKSSEMPTTIKVMPMDGADMQWRVHHGEY